MRGLFAALLFTLAETSALAAPSVDYTLAPEMKNGAPVAFDVSIRLVAPRSGKITLDLPDRGMGISSRWRFISDIDVTGAAITAPNPATRMLVAKPGAHITVRYRVHSAYSADPPSGDNPYAGAVIRPTWFAALGEFVFITPDNWDDVPATFHWDPIPKGWTVASDLEHGTMGRPMTVNDITDSTILGGTDVTVYRRPVTDGTVRLAVRGKWTFDTAHFADLIARIVSAQRDFWGNDVKGPFLVTLFPQTGAGSSGGTGRSDAFALYGTPEIGIANFTRTIGHEHMHTWIPGRIGTLPDNTDSQTNKEAAEYWLSEGFTDFYAERTLLKSGVWRLKDFAADLNTTLARYGSSPVRNAPNARIMQEFWTNNDVSQLPYDRGMLIAYLWDHRLRQATQDRVNLDRVMFAARDTYVAAPAGHKPDAVKNFLGSFRKVSGADLAADISRYIVKGDTVMLPPDIFGACATVADTTVPAFARGFDIDKTAAAGVFVGVDPKGPAYAAGIRNGMKRLAYVAGTVGDSRVLYSYRVADADGGHPRVIGFYPRGNTTVTFQEVALTPYAASHQDACTRAMSGG